MYKRVDHDISDSRDIIIITYIQNSYVMSGSYIPNVHSDDNVFQLVHFAIYFTNSYSFLKILLFIINV